MSSEQNDTPMSEILKSRGYPNVLCEGPVANVVEDCVDAAQQLIDTCATYGIDVGPAVRVIDPPFRGIVELDEFNCGWLSPDETDDRVIEILGLEHDGLEDALRTIMHSLAMVMYVRGREDQILDEMGSNAQRTVRARDLGLIVRFGTDNDPERDYENPHLLLEEFVSRRNSDHKGDK